MNLKTALLIGLAFGGIILSASDDNGKVTRRGFTVSNLRPETLADVKKDWNANMVRYMMRPDFMSQANHSKYPTYMDGWKEIVANLPGQLDNAKKLGILVVLDLHDIPNENKRTYPKGRDGTNMFWKDDKNLELMIKCWQEVAEICKDREEEIYFDIKNEPLDWGDFPSYAKKWPDWAQQTVDAIRSIDKKHAIIVEVGPGGLSWGFRSFPLLKGDNIIYSIHAYQPHEYTHQGIKDIANTDLAKAYLEKTKSWPGTFGDAGGGAWDKERLKKDLADVIEFQKKHNVKIYVGEFGVARWAPGADKYLDDLISIFEEYGWDWTCHAFRESPIWSPEHEDKYTIQGEKPEKSSDNKRAEVLKKYLKLNRE